MTSRPAILIARTVFPEVVQRLQRHFEVDAQRHRCGAQSRRAGAAPAGQGGRHDHGQRARRCGAAGGVPELRIAANIAVGYNNFDVPAMTAAGVQATNTPDVLTETTADFGFALLMATARRLTESEHFLRAGQWNRWALDMFAGADIHGGTLGILGRLNSAVRTECSKAWVLC